MGYDVVEHATVMPKKSCDSRHAYQLERELLEEERMMKKGAEREKKTSEEPHQITVHTDTSTHPHTHGYAKLGHDVIGEGHY